MWVVFSTILFLLYFVGNDKNNVINHFCCLISVVRLFLMNVNCREGSSLEAIMTVNVGNSSLLGIIGATRWPVFN